MKIHHSKTTASPQKTSPKEEAFVNGNTYPSASQIYQMVQTNIDNTRFQDNTGTLQLIADESQQQEQILQLQQMADAYSDASAPNLPNQTGLPDQLKSGIEALSGYNMDEVRVHYNSGRPAQLNALAYAQGTDIHLASGQEKYLPHEAWHVVQQKQGRVKAIKQSKEKVGLNDDERLEREADVMGNKALRFNSIYSQGVLQAKSKNEGVVQMTKPIREPREADQSGSAPARERPTGTIDNFEENMLFHGEEAFRHINERNTQGLRAIPDVAMPIADHFLDGLPGEIRDALHSAKDIARQISSYLLGAKRVEDIDIEGLYSLIERNIYNIRSIVHLTNRGIQFTSFIPYWGIFVKAIAICNDSYHIYESHKAVKAHRQAGLGQVSEHYTATLNAKEQERNEHIRNLIRHCAKFVLKVGSAAGVTAIIFKPPEIAIATGQAVARAFGAARHHREETTKISKSKRLTWSLIQEGIEVYRSGFWDSHREYHEKQVRLLSNLRVYSLSTPEFFEMNAYQQVQTMYGAIYQNI